MWSPTRPATADNGSLPLRAKFRSTELSDNAASREHTKIDPKEVVAIEASTSTPSASAFNESSPLQTSPRFAELPDNAARLTHTEFESKEIVASKANASTPPASANDRSLPIQATWGPTKLARDADSLEHTKFRPRELVTIEASGKHFRVQKDTLTQSSRFFKALLSSSPSRAEPDGSYYIDIDPAIFQYILDYLRRVSLPLCLDSEQNLDHSTYSRILSTADHLGIPALAAWIRTKRYEKVLTTHYAHQWWPDLVGKTSSRAGFVSAELMDRTERVYVCPTFKGIHRSIEDCLHRSFIFEAEKNQGRKPEYHVRVTTGYLVKTRMLCIDFDRLSDFDEPSASAQKTTASVDPDDHHLKISRGFNVIPTNYEGLAKYVEAPPVLPRGV